MALVPYNSINIPKAFPIFVGRRSKTDNIKDIVSVANSLIDRLMYNDLLLLLAVAESIIFELQDENNDIHDDNDNIHTSLATIQKIKKKTLSLLSS